ncbi:angiomotin [Gracilaria domingensis]|nr:angiomotin [Gracilaria domingensis]
MSDHIVNFLLGEAQSSPPRISDVIAANKNPTRGAEVGRKKRIDPRGNARTSRVEVRVHGRCGNGRRGGDTGPSGELVADTIRGSEDEIVPAKDRSEETTPYTSIHPWNITGMFGESDDEVDGAASDSTPPPSFPVRRTLQFAHGINVSPAGALKRSTGGGSGSVRNHNRKDISAAEACERNRHRVENRGRRGDYRAEVDEHELGRVGLDGVVGDGGDSAGGVLGSNGGPNANVSSSIGVGAGAGTGAGAVVAAAASAAAAAAEVAAEVVPEGDEAVDAVGEADPPVIDLEAMLNDQEKEHSAIHNALYERREDIYSGRFRSTSGRKRRRNGSCKLTAEQRRLRREKERKAELARKSPKELWNEMLSDQLLRCPDYFTSRNALLKDKENMAAKGKIVYPGLKLIAENCQDLKEIYLIRYKTKQLLQARGSTGSFDVFRSIVGQFMRWAIASGALKKNEGWKPMALFKLMSNEKLVRIFVNYFIRAASFSTVAGKCNALRTLCKYAALRMVIPEEKNRVLRVEMMLNTTFNAAKSRAREQYRANQSADDRILKQTIVTKKHLELGIRTAKAKLEDILEVFRETEGKESRKQALSEFAATKGLLDKWCVNFVGLIALTGGGQRPQAYARLQCPSRQSLKDLWSAEIRTPKGMFEMKTFREKTARALDVPNVNFPKFILPFVAFHVEIVRPIVMKRRKIPMSQEFKRNRPLLFHTRTGLYLTSSHISRSIKTFMRGIDSSLKSVTAMTLRTSFATVMLHDYRNGKFTRKGKKLEEDKFLDLMAKQMNTSVEQLRTTYMSCHSQDFVEITALLTRHFCSLLGEESDDEDDLNEEYDEGSGASSCRDEDDEEGRDSAEYSEDDDEEVYNGMALFQDEVEEEEVGEGTHEGHGGRGGGGGRDAVCEGEEFEEDNEEEDEVQPVRRRRRRRKN